MKLENQLCSLKLSNLLKELGVLQESYFYWVKITRTDNWELLCNGDDYSSIRSYIIDDCAYSAFTVAELGELLPMHINDWNLTYCKRLTNGEIINFVIYSQLHRTFCIEGDIKEADARAKMLIYLIENKLIEVPNGTSKLA